MRKILQLWTTVVCTSLAYCVQVHSQTDQQTHKIKRQPTITIELHFSRERNYYGGIQLGNISQLFRVIFDIGSHISWVPLSGKGWENHLEYVPSWSDTKRMLGGSFSYHYISGNIYGTLLEEQIAVGDRNLGRMTIGLANDSRHTNNLPLPPTIPGIIGLSFASTLLDVPQTFLDFLQSQGHISEPVFTMVFQREDVDGEIIFGPRELSPASKCVPKLPGPKWTMSITGLSIDETMIVTQRQTVLLGTFYEHNYGPRALVDEINRRLGYLRRYGGTYIFRCTREMVLPTISLHFEGFTLSMSADDYFIWPEMTDGYCSGAFVPWSDGRLQHWMFGTHFLRKYCTTFDKLRETITFQEQPC